VQRQPLLRPRERVVVPSRLPVELGDADELVGRRLIADEHLCHGIDIAGQLRQRLHDLRDPESS